MLAKDMCSKNQEVDPLFAQSITKDFLIQRIFRVLRNSLFRTNDLYSKNKTEQDLCKERTCSPFFCRDIIWRRDSISEISIPFLIDLKEMHSIVTAFQTKRKYDKSSDGVITSTCREIQQLRKLNLLLLRTLFYIHLQKLHTHIDRFLFQQSVSNFL